MGIDSFEKIKSIIKDIFDMTTKNRVHNSSRVHLFGVGICIDIVCIVLLLMLIKFELIPLTCGAIIFAIVKCVYIYLVVHINKGSFHLMNLYNMVTTDNHMDHKIIKRQFNDKLNNNVDFEKNFNIVLPILWHRLYYEILFSNNAHGSTFANHYKRHICKKGKNPIILGGYINASENQSLLYEYNIKISFLRIDLGKCKSVIELRIISNSPTPSLMPLIEFIRIYSYLIKKVENISDTSSFSEICDLFMKIKACKLVTNVVDFDSNIISPIREYICHILTDINKNDNSMSKSIEYIELCKLISNCNSQNPELEKLQGIWMAKELSNITNGNYSDKKKAITNILKSAKPPPDNGIISFIIKKIKKG